VTAARLTARAANRSSGPRFFPLFLLFREAYGGKKITTNASGETENSRASEEHTKKNVGEGNEIRLEGANQTTNSSGAEDKQSAET
jgi:hypothetical protein